MNPNKITQYWRLLQGLALGLVLAVTLAAYSPYISTCRACSADGYWWGCALMGCFPSTR